jgi:hypothetical protein
MGHWSESLADEVILQVTRRSGIQPDRTRILELLAQTGHEIDVLAGRSFRPARHARSMLVPNGLPFMDLPDLLVGTLQTDAGGWEIPDPVDPRMAVVGQVLTLDEPAPRAVPSADALWYAGQLIAAAWQGGQLSREYVLSWLGNSMDQPQRLEVMRQVMDPAVRFNVPIAGGTIGGWWIQISRRLIWITNDTEDEGRLVEPLFDETADNRPVAPLVAVEPILIAARMTQHPSDWAFSARIWAQGVRRTMERPWSKIAPAIHGHGIPTVTLDANSTASEIACQVVLKGYWHGYIGNDEPALAGAVMAAYPQQVQSIQRAIHAATSASAAAMLLEQLVRPGFDHARGAEAARRYVRRKASIVVMEYKKNEAPDRYPWTQVGISERHFYKLLPLFAQKTNGRYSYDHKDVVARMKAHLNDQDNLRTVRSAALELLREHGFGDDAARKWLQRHKPEEALDAWPRGSHRPTN